MHQSARRDALLAAQERGPAHRVGRALFVLQELQVQFLMQTPSQLALVVQQDFFLSPDPLHAPLVLAEPVLALSTRRQTVVFLVDSDFTRHQEVQFALSVLAGRIRARISRRFALLVLLVSCLKGLGAFLVLQDYSPHLVLRIARSALLGKASVVCLKF